ncbi:MAG: response regulator transcription factor [Chloroflexia bacterium]|nr:response regulator transcription factor [Chloroflexia bacterium]
MRSRQVALIEAQHIFRAGVRGVLEDTGRYRVVAATGTGADAARLCRGHTIDLALIGLPGADPSDIRIAAHLSHPQPLIVFLSPAPDDQFRRAAAPAGTAAVLPRDISAEALIRTLDQLLANEHRLAYPDAAAPPASDAHLLRSGCD